MTLAATILCTSLALTAQSFEVASIKPADPANGRGGRATSSGDRVTYANTTLLNVLARAYRVKGFQIEGPDWIRTERYDILAKAPENSPADQFPLMLQALLNERFQLKVHREQREMPVYLLVSTKPSARLQKTDGALGYAVNNGRRELKNHTMSQLADFLIAVFQRPVYDKTDLPGTYTFPLELSVEEFGGLNARSDISAPSIFTSLNDLGLKLESSKASIEIIVVDSGSKVPTAN